MEPAWQGGFPIQSASFGQTFQSRQNHEDWEDWLRWDPALDADSPEDDTAHSGSSKTDSPIQDAVLPMAGGVLGANTTLAPPLIVGQDELDFGLGDLATNDAFLFGTADELPPQFDFQTMMPLEQQQSPTAKLDTHLPSWTFDALAEPLSITLSALANDQYQYMPPVPATVPDDNSPHSTTQVRTSISSDSSEQTKKRGGRKRKIDSDEELEDMNGDSPEGGDGPPMKKTGHNVIEKRYRNNLNDKIVELRSAVPSLRAMSKGKRGDNTEDLEGLTPAHKLNKATIMAKATEYIRHLEKRNKSMADEMNALKARLASVEVAIGRSRDRQSSMSNGSPSDAARVRVGSAAPHDQTRLNHAMIQQQYNQSQQTPSYNPRPAPAVDAQNQPQYVHGRGGGGLMSKVMLGTMAGVMVMEGFHESQSGEEGQSRGLFSAPLNLMKRQLDFAAQPSANTAMLPLLKVCVVIGALLYLLIPLFSFSSRRKQKARTAAIRLPYAPSLASPIEVRRKAWLTAIQTVWVPKHFLLEVVSVTLKMITLSIRQLVGTEAYNSLTGANKEDERARIKGWDIAIDAQLAGGDQEVSYYRLLLTLMESGTLPDSPARLMQKAVHFRVFFWEVANAGYGNLSGFKHFTEQVGRRYWNSARRQHKELARADALKATDSSSELDVEPLPDHLASLVELDCDEVLTDEMIQRAWNLAWNKPSAYGTVANAARNAVVEDHAIRSPLDAVAAWYANTTIDETLVESLGENASRLDIEHYIGSAVSVAPPASATLARALTAKAVLSSCNRDANILAALDALKIEPSNSREINAVSHIPAAPDVQTALTIAKLLALSSPKAPITAHERALDAVQTLYIPPASFTLLTSVAVSQLLKHMSADPYLTTHAARGIEGLAASLRIWAGTSVGRNASIGVDDCARMVSLCLNIAKRVGGWDDRDSGYGSAEVGTPEGSPTKEKVGVVI